MNIQKGLKGKKSLFKKRDQDKEPEGRICIKSVLLLSRIFRATKYKILKLVSPAGVCEFIMRIYQILVNDTENLCETWKETDMKKK